MGSARETDPENLRPGERLILADSDATGDAYVEGSARHQVAVRLAAAELGEWDPPRRYQVGGVFRIGPRGREALRKATGRR